MRALKLIKVQFDRHSELPPEGLDRGFLGQRGRGADAHGAREEGRARGGQAGQEGRGGEEGHDEGRRMSDWTIAGIFERDYRNVGGPEINSAFPPPFLALYRTSG
ncbi:hypothetical protein BV22DRAFT_445682 [Leucogyrophana mollusca]|uniref:Uncharacterized protein n=1 Tax=Leucogyrophana mollusca TaxID=85980 RepID=A0ACB8BHE3_9AGAM|nr:hypothetical protein BV22DRAFT_445682 [Leucogyrophana mollusca]